MIKKVTDIRLIEKLFENWQQSLILSCTQEVMGNVYAPDCENPKSAMSSLGGFCFLAGEPIKALALYRPDNISEEFITMVPQNDAWEDLLEDCYDGKARCSLRYAMKREPHVFDKKKLRQIVGSIDPAYILEPMDESLYHYCQNNEWSYALVSQYPDYQTYKRLGIGVMVTSNGLPVSGASSYATYHSGIEIEIDTNKEYRKKGLASACGAKLIMECLERGLYPSWDAQNMWSVALAEKLGYHLDHEYIIYVIKSK